MKKLLMGLSLLTVMSCQNSEQTNRPYTVYEKDAAFFNQVVNTSTPDGQVSAAAPVILENADYPISIQLYDNGTFYYNLPKLGDGYGEWHARDGQLTLYAERKIFVMYMYIKSIDPANPDALAIEFSDRFGPRFLPLTKK